MRHPAPPDRFGTPFVDTVERLLERPVAVTVRALDRRVGDARERLDAWLRARMGWATGTDRSAALLRAARLANYIALVRLVFHAALRKHLPAMAPLVISDDVRSSAALLDTLTRCFAQARVAAGNGAGDGAGIFDIDPADLADTLPFLDDEAVDCWRDLAAHIHLLDLPSADRDVIGGIFEALISPEERHKYGQFYTRPQVADLINAFCIRAGTDTVLDPGCGGGTFLVRAYARKRHLSPDLDHTALADGIQGVDRNPAAARLAAVNLAGRGLADGWSPPRIVAADFLDLAPGRPVHRIAIPEVDAVIANPPYVRQEDIPIAEKAAYRRRLADATGFQANGRSDLHVYFWAQATRFLKPGGRLGFLTSSQWLDVDYGFPLQHFLLDRFRIVAILESRAEPWFVGARVQTAITIAERETDAVARDDNLIRFVQITRPLADILGPQGDTARAMAGADALRDTILAARQDATGDDFRIRCRRQGDLRRDGEETGHRLKGRASYGGVKWGIPLRAPDLWHELRELGAARWRRLGELARVRRGLTTGKDSFFYLDDVSESALCAGSGPIPLAAGRTVARSDVSGGRLRIVEALGGERWAIEAAFLEPIVHSPMQIDGYEVTRAHCARLVLMVSAPPAELAGTHAAAYIARGEALSVHRGATAVSRAGAGGRPWYDLAGTPRAGLLWAKAHQYRHCAPVNPHRFAANGNLYTVETEDTDAAAAVLNSTIVLLAKQLHGRPVGVEGNLKTEIVDVMMMPVPDWTQGPPPVRGRLLAAFARLRERKVLGLLSERSLRRDALTRRGGHAALDALSTRSEFDLPDRHALDDAVLELIGVADARRRAELRAHLYDHLRKMFATARAKEEEALANRSVKRRPR